MIFDHLSSLACILFCVHNVFDKMQLEYGKMRNIETDKSIRCLKCLANKTNNNRCVIEN